MWGLRRDLPAAATVNTAGWTPGDSYMRQPWQLPQQEQKRERRSNYNRQNQPLATGGARNSALTTAPEDEGPGDQPKLNVLAAAQLARAAGNQQNRRLHLHSQRSINVHSREDEMMALMFRTATETRDVITGTESFARLEALALDLGGVGPTGSSDKEHFHKRELVGTSTVARTAAVAPAPQDEERDGSHFAGFSGFLASEDVGDRRDISPEPPVFAGGFLEVSASASLRPTSKGYDSTDSGDEQSMMRKSLPRAHALTGDAALSFLLGEIRDSQTGGLTEGFHRSVVRGQETLLEHPQLAAAAQTCWVACEACGARQTMSTGAQQDCSGVSGVPGTSAHDDEALTRFKKQVFAHAVVGTVIALLLSASLLTRGKTDLALSLAKLAWSKFVPHA